MSLRLDNLRLDNLIAIGVLTVLCFAALAHGAVEPWSMAAVKLLTCLLVLLWGIKSIWDKHLSLTIPTTAWPLFAFLLLGTIQSVSLTSQSGGRLSLSQDLEATRSTVSMLLALVLLFLLAANFLANRERLRVMVGFLTFFGFILSVFGLLQYFTWNGKFYWLRPTLSDLGSPFGPFANHNHFAGLMELLIGLPIALLVAGAIRREERILYGFLAAVIGVTILFSLSRGGMFSLLVELGFIALFSGQLRRQARHKKISFFWRGTVLMAVLLAIFAGTLWIGTDPVVNRLVGHNQDTLSTSRLWIWLDAANVFSSYPVSGAGLGSFQTVYPRTSGYDGSQGFVAQAHNDYLQVLADGGIIGGALALWFIWGVFRDVRRGILAHDPLIAGIALGSGAGIVGLLAHSLLDFNLQIPSNAMMFLLLTTVASNCGLKAIEPKTSLEFATSPQSHPRAYKVGVSG